MKVKDIMRTEYVSFSADDNLAGIVKTFSEKKINSAPVFDSKEFVGIVSDFGMAQYFVPKEFRFLWAASKPTPIEQVKKVTAGQLAKKPILVLSPEQTLESALPRMIRAGECIPVMKRGKMLGLVRGEDLTEFFLKELAAGDYQENAAVKEDAAGEGIGSDMDKILEIVRREKEVPCTKIAKELGLSLKTAEKLCDSLGRHDLIEMKHSFLMGSVARVNRHEKN